MNFQYIACIGILLFFYSNQTLATNGGPKKGGNGAEQGAKCLPITLKYKGQDARRIWIGSILPKPVREHVEKLQGDIEKMGLRGAHKESRDRLHVTLKFLGSIDNTPKPVNALQDALMKIPLNKTSLMAAAESKKAGWDMTINKVQLLVKPNGSPKLIWAEVESPAFHKLHDEIESALVRFCDRDSRPYKAHITLFTFPDNAKMPTENTVKAINSIKPNIEQFRARSFKILQSHKAPNPFTVLLKIGADEKR